MLNKIDAKICVTVVNLDNFKILKYFSMERSLHVI